MIRAAFLVDGFNLYHSLKDARTALGGKPTKWLDLRALCLYVLPRLAPGMTLGPIHYFSALAKHLQYRDPTITARHLAYVSCLEATGVVVRLGSFKKRRALTCKCGRLVPGGYEEKESDVALAVELIELFVRDEADAAIVISGDSDIAPAIRCAKRLFPGKKVLACFPYKRRSLELRDATSGHFDIDKASYPKLQFADPFTLPSGKTVAKPLDW